MGDQRYRFLSVRIFDSQQFKTMDHDVKLYIQDFKDLESCDDSPVYIKLVPEESNLDLKTFWKNNQTILPKLFNIDSWALMIPVNSADVERSISKYN